VEKDIIGQDKILLRKQIPVKFRWDIESLYSTINKWEHDYRKVEQLRKELIEYKDNFTQDIDSFLSCLKIRDELSELLQKIYTYAHMRKDEDNQNNDYQSNFYRASGLLVKIDEDMSFIEPGILSIDLKKLKEWVKDNSQLKIYEHYLENIYRKKEHILSPAEESIIAQTGEITMVPENSFDMLNHADIKFPSVRDREGRKIQLSHGNFITLLREKDRDFRKKVYQKYYHPYLYHRNTYASLLAGNLKKDRFYRKVRKYRSSLQAALFEDNIPVEIYENLINSVHKNIYLLQNYIKLKRDFLDIKSFYMYDMYVPLYEKVLTFDFPEAQNIIIEALKPLGEHYISVVREGFRERWVDVYENKGKTSGAYSTGSYQSKPFILMNFQGTIEDVYTLAHEMGHSMHSYFSHKSQPFVYSGYAIFLAEIASTTNEALLTNYLLEKARDKGEKLAILNHFLEQFRTTLFRQVMFAEFEKNIHEYDEKEGSITSDWLSRQYEQLNKDYYGQTAVIDKYISLEWARIPHFYYNYYVYQYATGFTAAIAFSQKILNNSSSTVEKYLNFLSKGSSGYPISILNEAGIDLSVDKNINESMTLFKNLLSQLERIKK